MEKSTPFVNCKDYEQRIYQEFAITIIAALSITADNRFPTAFDWKKRMKWQKLLLFLAVSSAALGCFALRWSLLTIFDQLTGLWQLVASIHFVHWPDRFRPILELDSSTWWIVCAAFVLDLLYVVWLCRRRRFSTYHSADNNPLSSHYYFGANDYEEQLRQRYAALLARYQDPALVQFLLNREAARAQRLEQRFEVSEGGAPTATRTLSPPASEQERQPLAKRLPVAMVVNPLGV